MLDVGEIVKSVDEDSCHFNLVTWSGSIYKIMKDIDLLLSWHSTRWNSSWSLLDSEFLVISVNSVNFIDLVATS